MGQYLADTLPGASRSFNGNWPTSYCLGELTGSTLSALARKFQWQWPGSSHSRSPSQPSVSRRYLMDSRRTLRTQPPLWHHPLKIYVLILRCPRPTEFLLWIFSLFLLLPRTGQHFSQQPFFFRGCCRIWSRCCQGQQLVVINELIISEMCFWVTLNNGCGSEGASWAWLSRNCCEIELKKSSRRAAEKCAKVSQIPLLTWKDLFIINFSRVLFFFFNFFYRSETCDAARN